MAASSKQEADPNEFAVRSLGTAATVLLAVAGLSGLHHAVVTLWSVCLASILYIVAFWVSQHNTLSHKNRFAAGMIGVCVLTAVAIQVHLGKVTQEKELVPKPAPLPAQAPPSIVVHQTGDAIAVGQGNSANSGDGNVVEQQETNTLRKKSQGKK